MGPVEGTTAASTYMEEFERQNTFFAFINDAASVADTNSQRLHPERPVEPPVPVGSSAPMSDRRVYPGAGALNEFRSHGNTIFQIFLSRAADNYLVYISDIMAEILIRTPEALRSSETIPIEQVLGHESMSDLIKHLTERKVQNLVNGGMREIERHFSRRLKFDLFSDEEESKAILRIIAARKVIAHNRGIVDERFVARTPDSGFTVGERLPLTYIYMSESVGRLKRSVIDIDVRAVKKFRLGTGAVSAPEYKHS